MNLLIFNALSWEQRKFSEIAQRESATKKSSTDFPSIEYEDVVSEVGILNKDVRLKETQKTGIGFDGSQVLYGKLRPYLHNWLSPDFSGVAVGDWWVLKPVNIDKSFLFRLIQTEKFDDIANQSSGSKMPRADWNLLSNTEFMVPVEIEEERKIGQYFSDLDHLITLHQSKAESWKNKENQLSTISWEQRKVSDVAELTTGGTPSTKVKEYWNSQDIPWLSSGEVHKKYIKSTDTMISKAGYENSSARMVPANSVLIALAGQGKTRGTVAVNRIPLATNQSIAAMTFNDEVFPDFVFSNMESRYDELRSISSGDGSRGGLNKQLVGDVIIPCPTIKEQKAIGNFFNDLNHLITLHHRKLNRTQICINRSFLYGSF